jgi:probable rRNA maturation factor
MDESSSAEAGARIRVAVRIDPDFSGLLSAATLRRVAELTLRTEGVGGEVTLVIAGDQTIQRLNRDFLDQDAPTDVLAFSSQEDEGSFVSAPEAGGYLGDVIVSYPGAVAQAEEAGHFPEQEMRVLIVHGILHLVGYDHATEEERTAMWARQDAILGQL